VDLLSFADGSEPSGSQSRLRELCGEVETVHLARPRSWGQAWLGLLSTTPSQVAYYRSREMTRRASSRIASGTYDVVFTQLVRMAPHALGTPHPRHVLFLADALGLALERSGPFQPAWKRPGVRWEARRVGAYEVDATHHARESWVVSDVDRLHLEARGAVNVRTVPHGVDERLYDVTRDRSSEVRVVFLGNLSVPHNVDAAHVAARDIWPRLAPRLGPARLVLAGADPVPSVIALAREPGVVVTGALDDLRPFWSGATVLLAPLRYSTGIQNKVIEAMAAGVPAVTTPAVAAGLGARDGEHLLCGESPQGLAEAVARCVHEHDLTAARTARARAFVRARFSWDEPVRRLEELVAGSGAISAPPFVPGSALAAFEASP
jgi:glycosyltransferase involved in cell wall biosynthesis